MTSNALAISVSVFLLACQLSACGGSGGGTSEPPTTQLPPPPPTFSYDGSGLLVAIQSDDGLNLSTLTGEVTSYRLTIYKAETDIPVALSLSGAVAGITIEETSEGTFLQVDGTQIAAGSTFPVTITAENTARGRSASADVVINLLELETIATGTLTPDGGAVLSDGGAVGIQVDPGELSADVTVEIKRAITPNGILKIRMLTDRDISGETALVRIISNREYVGSGTTSSNNTLGVEKLANTSAMAADYPIDSDNTISRMTGYFQLLGPRWASIDSVLGQLAGTCEFLADPDFGLFVCLDLDPNAAVLESTKPAECFGLNMSSVVPQGCDQADVGAEYQAILFVHGFNVTGLLGGGEGTWGQFPEALVGYPTPDFATVVPFEFRWRTNASFRVVADDLASAITRVYNLTGRPVHIVAHSFGGLLVRTLLSGEAESGQSFDPSYIHSVTTLGTPHSGIYSEETIANPSNLTFPKGQDFGVMAACDQISCWQVGESGGRSIDFAEPHLEKFGAGPFGGLIQDLSVGEFTEQVPFIVGIGLEREEGANALYGDGDKLISFNGQRVSPNLRGEFASGSGNWPAVIRCGDTGYPLVTEVVLGTIDDVTGYSPDTVGPGTVVPDYKMTSQTTRGYSHNRVPPLDPDNDFEYAEAYVEVCDSADQSCQIHSALELVRSVIDTSHAQSGVPYCISPPAEVPQPSLEGYEGSYVGEYPAKGTPITVRYTRVIGPGPEVYGGEIQVLNTFSNRIIRSTTDFGPDSIRATYIDSGRSSTAVFNGPVYYFEDTSPRIINAALDPSSDYSETEARVTFDDHAVWVNLSGVQIDVGDSFLIQLELAR